MAKYLLLLLPIFCQAQSPASQLIPKSIDSIPESYYLDKLGWIRDSLVYSAKNDSVYTLDHDILADYELISDTTVYAEEEEYALRDCKNIQNCVLAICAPIGDSTQIFYYSYIPKITLGNSGYNVYPFKGSLSRFYILLINNEYGSDKIELKPDGTLVIDVGENHILLKSATTTEEAKKIFYGN